MNALDTNIWIYSHDTRDPEKQRRALELIQTVRPLALPWQVGCEFLAASRRLAPMGFKPDDAWDALADMQTMADVVLLPDTTLWPPARRLQEQFQLAFWDALIVAACVRGGVTALYSEDFGPHVVVTGLTIRNPFSA